MKINTQPVPTSLNAHFIVCIYSTFYLELQYYFDRVRTICYGHPATGTYMRLDIIKNFFFERAARHCHRLPIGVQSSSPKVFRNSGLVVLRDMVSEHHEHGLDLVIIEILSNCNGDSLSSSTHRTLQLSELLTLTSHPAPAVQSC